ncbi:MAG: polyphosphate kinase 1, partial [Anaerolineae bacterium]
PELGRDLISLFNYITGYSPGQPYKKVIVAPRDMRNAFDDLIQQEIDFQKRSGNGRIIAKMNAIDDVKIIQQLYRASQAGVEIDLVVRGHCCLRPDLPGYSDNIRVISIVGRFLEHDRIFYFGNNGEPITLIGSADWRHRNLEERVELVVPVDAPPLKARLVEVLDLALIDNVLAWDLHADGHYERRYPGEDEEPSALHQILMEQAISRGEPGV